MRDGDSVQLTNDQDQVILTVDEAPVPGIHEGKQGILVRLTIEDALSVVDDLKRVIQNALKRR